MQLRDVTYEGPRIDDEDILGLLPIELRHLLEKKNGFILYGGGLHVRGACINPAWHSLREVIFGEHALANLYSHVKRNDIPFAEDALGEQFILRDGVVQRLHSETGYIESLKVGLEEFLEASEANPVEYLGLQPLVQFYSCGGMLRPGELLSAYPPFCTTGATAGVSLKAVSTEERLRFLADFASQITEIRDREQVQIKVVE